MRRPGPAVQNATMGWGSDPEVPIRGRRLGERTIRRALVALGLLAIAVAVVRLVLGTVFYPLGIASPDVAGIIVSTNTTGPDAPEVSVILASGAEVRVLRTDRDL